MIIICHRLESSSGPSDLILLTQYQGPNPEQNLRPRTSWEWVDGWIFSENTMFCNIRHQVEFTLW